MTSIIVTTVVSNTPTLETGIVIVAFAWTFEGGVAPLTTKRIVERGPDGLLEVKTL